MLKRIALPGGINRESTQFAAVDSWYDVNNMRFRGGVPETVGGWGRLTIDVDETGEPEFELEGIGRKCFGLRTYAGSKFRFVATNWKLYAIRPTSVTDITPNKKAVVPLTNPATTVKTIGADPAGGIATIVDAGTDDLSAGDFVRFDSFVTFGGATAETWNREDGFQILTFDLASTSYTIFVPGISSDVGPGGGDINAYYKVASGLNAPETGSGWGVGPWGGDDYTATVYTMETITDDITIISTTQATLNVTSQTRPTGLTNPDQVYVIGLTSTTLDGINLDDINDNWWTVVSTDSNTITINLPYDAITGSGTGGGKAATYYRYDASEEEVDGATRGWSTESDDVTVTGEIRRVYIDNYNEDLLFANDGGPIYYWDTSVNAPGGAPDGGPTKVAKELKDFGGSTDSPVVVNSFLVSKKDGHVVALGCNDIGTVTVNDINPLLVRWSDQNVPFNWTPSSSSTSGGQVLRSGSRIIGGVSTKDEVIIFTDSAVYSMRFIGIPDVFSFTLVTDGVEILNDGSAVNAANAVFFMGNDGFYVYSGSVSPLSCPVTNYVFDDFNYDMKEKVFGAVNSAFSEVMWFYPSSDSFEPNRYVTLNYDSNTWSYGKYDMSALSQSVFEDVETSNVRTAWSDATAFDFPMASYVTTYNSMMVPADKGGGAGVTEKSAVMLHEMGTQAQGDAIIAHVESGDISIADGESVAFYSRVIPDVRAFDVADENIVPVITLELKGQDYPGSATQTSVTQNISISIGSGDPCDFSFTPTGNASGVRGRGRSVKMKVSASSSGYGWRVGDFRIDLQPDGRR